VLVAQEDGVRGETWAGVRARADEAGERVLLLVTLLREQDADAQTLWKTWRALVLRFAGLLSLALAHQRLVDRCTDQLVAFAVRYDAGDRDGASLALRAWINQMGAAPSRKETGRC
jgi:hypothetical protein